MGKLAILDSNSIICFFESGFLIADKGGYTKPEEIEIFKSLLKAVKNGKLLLLLSEVSVLEIKRIKEEKLNDVNEIYKNVSESVETTNINNKKISQTALDEINKRIEKTRDKELKNIELAEKIFDKICKHKNTHIINLTGEILVSSYRRGIMGKKPFAMRYMKNNEQVHDIQPDCVIVESADLFLKDFNDDSEVYLVTNDAHFYTSEDKIEVDPAVKSELKVVKSFTSISGLLNDVLGLEPKQPEVVEKELSAFPLPQKNQIDIGVSTGINDGTLVGTAVGTAIGTVAENKDPTKV